jgi:hypothetical protein
MKLLNCINFIKGSFGEHIICKLIRIQNRELILRCKAYSSLQNGEVDCYDNGFYLSININNLLIYKTNIDILIYINTSFCVCS